MDSETKKLMEQTKNPKIPKEPFIKEKNKTYFSFFSYTKLGIFNVFIILISIIIILIIRTNFSIFKSNNSENIIKDLKYYQDIQNNFCDNIRYVFKKEIEETISLFNVSINGTNFQMFLYKELDYLSDKIRVNKFYDDVGTLHMLNALNYYSNKNNYKTEDILIIDIGANVGWYTIFFGLHNYSVLSFEPYPENYYVLKKNYCRNIKTILEENLNNLTMTLINRTIYPTESACGYYQDIKNSRKDLVVCDLRKEDNFEIDYMRMDIVNSTNLADFIPLIKHKKITLLRLDLEFEGENAIKSGIELITKYHIPFIFIDFNYLIFSIHMTTAQDFFKFFIDNGYKISLNGFLTNDFIDIEELMIIRASRINLYIVYVGQ